MKEKDTAQIRMEISKKTRWLREIDKSISDEDFVRYCNETSSWLLQHKTIHEHKAKLYQKAHDDLAKAYNNYFRK